MKLNKEIGLIFGYILIFSSVFSMAFPSIDAEEALSGNTAPEMILSIPDLSVNEDTVLTFSFDLRDHFTDDLSNTSVLDYDIELRGENASKISAKITGYRIKIDTTITPNFFTDQSMVSIEGRMVVTDTGDAIGSNPLTNRSNWFAIEIQPINDLPIITGNSLDDLWVWEGTSMNVTDLDDHDLFYDVEGDPLRYFPVADLSFPGYNASAEFRVLWHAQTNQLRVMQNQNTNFTGQVPVRLFCYDNINVDFIRDPFINFMIEVRNVNDPPAVNRSSPDVFIVKEGSRNTFFNMSSYGFFVDGDEDTLKYHPVADLSFPHYNVSTEFEIYWRSMNNHLEVILNISSDWTGDIPVKLYCTDQSDFNLNEDPSVDLIFRIENVNDLPVWKEIGNIEVQEDLAAIGFVDLSEFIVDVDSDPQEMEYSIISYSNYSHIYLELEEDEQYLLSFEPVTENWFGTSLVSISVEDMGIVVNHSFTISVEPVDDLPSINIVQPAEDDTLYEGIFNVIGEAFDVEGIEKVEVFFQGNWSMAAGTDSWGITLETPDVEEILDDVSIQVRVTDTGGWIAFDHVNITILPVIIPPPDQDGDGVTDENDDFPNDRSASLDTDGDGYPDEWNSGMGPEDSNSGLKLDVFPTDPEEWFDSDGDGYGDNEDEFLYDGTEWSDVDGDGVGDNADEFPNDPDERSDSDGDGIGNNRDAFPSDPAASVDEDNDGFPDEWNPGMSEDDSTSGLKLDHYPDDSMKWEKEGFFEATSGPVLVLIFMLPPILILAFIAIFLYIRKSSKGSKVVSIPGDEGEMVLDEE